MRIVLDLQACQASSMNRGIGRYSLALALAIARNAGRHDVRVVVNTAFPDSAAALRRAFSSLLPPASIASFSTPLPCAEGDPDNHWRMQAAERIREHYLASLRPDVVHVASLFEGLGDNSVSSILQSGRDFDTAVTLYDLIPLMRKERYLDDPNTAAWYHRKLQSLREADLLLAISANARQEALDVLDIAPGKVINISSAVDGLFRPRTLPTAERSALLDRHGLHRPFLMYTGGVDYRKNVEGLMEAYAALPDTLRRQYQLAVVCSVHAPDRVRLQRVAARLALGPDDFVLTGYVTDDDLVGLYNCTDLFVFPSLHEGFGLPVLEAMACGAPVIGSNTSSIPEVIGRADAMFDPASVPAITAAMARVLTDPSHAADLRAHGLAQAAQFSWDASAQRALAAFEEKYAERAAACAANVRVAAAVNPAPARPRLAYVSPLPPARSGVADYSAILLPELARFYDIDVVLAQPDLDAALSGQFAQRGVDWFDANAHTYDRIVYQFGNSAFHAHMFSLLARHPGVVVMHDFFLSGVVHHADAASTLPNYYSRTLYLSHGYRPLLEERAEGRVASYRAYPCNRAVLERATGVIVHSAHAVMLATRWYGPDMARDWCVLPLLSKAPATVDRAAARRGLALDDSVFLLCSFGNIAPTKCVDDIVQAWLDSDVGRDPHCHLVFVGQAGEDDFGTRLRARIADHPRIRITGYTSETLYQTYLAAADGAVQLRTSSRGETSGAVLNCLAWGVPTIINAHGSAAELPQAAVLRLDDTFSTAQLAQAIDALHVDRALRSRLCAAARHAIAAHSPARAAQAMHDAIEQFSRSSAGAHEQALLRAIAQLGSGASDNDYRQAAAAIAANRPSLGARQLLVDVTHVAACRMTDPAIAPLRAMIGALVAGAPLTWRIEPVRHDGKRYRYARRFTLDLLGCPDLLIEDAVADASAGDVLLQTGAAPPALPPAWLACGVVPQAAGPQDAATVAALLAQLAEAA